MWNTQSQCYQRKRLNPGEQSTPSCLYGSKIGDQNNRAESYIYLYDKESHWCGSLLLLCLNLSWSLHTIVYTVCCVSDSFSFVIVYVLYTSIKRWLAVYTDLFQLLLGIGIIRQHALHPTRFCTVFIFFFNSPVSPFIWMPTQTCVLVCPRVCCAWKNRGLSFLDRPFLMFVHKPKKKQNKNTFLHSYVMQDNIQIKSRQLL